MEAFFRSAARLPSRSSWTVDEAARYAALKEGYLLQFLSEHKGALATARRLGFFHLQSQPPSPSVAAGGEQRGRARAAADAASAPASKPARDNRRGPTRRASCRRTQPHASAPAVASSSAPAEDGGHAAADAGISTGDTPSPQPNSAKRRSAARSARKHAGRQRAIRCHILAVLYVLRLRRRVRLRCALQDLEELSTAPGPVSKLDRSQRSSSASSVASSTRAADRPPSGSSSSAGSSSSVTFVIGCQRCDSRSKRVELCHPCEDEVAYHSTLDGQGYIPPPPSLCSAADAAAAREGARRPAKRRGSRWGPALLR